MNVICDPKTDTLSVVFKPGPVAESDEVRPGVILDSDAVGDLIGPEILDASTRVSDLPGVSFKVAS